MGLGDVFQVQPIQRAAGQEVTNVFFYEQIAPFVSLTGKTTAQILAEEFNLKVLPKIAAIQAPSVSTVEIVSQNLFVPADTGSLVTSSVGAAGVGGDPLPNFIAVDFVLQGANREVKNGRKRFGGLLDGFNDSGAVQPSTIPALVELGEAIAAPIRVGTLLDDPVIFVPCIVKRVKTTSEGKVKYTLPTTPANKVISLITEALFRALLTSQNSRKIGVGS